ncbi:MAG: preprotein translocase subunit SecE [Ruminococcus sp.]
MADIEKNAGQEAVEKKAKKAAAKADSNKSGSKSKKDAKEKKGFFSRIAGWFKDLKKEFKKVVWPDRKKVFNNTLVVLAVVIIGSVVVGLIDTGLLKLMQFLMGLSN